MIDIYLGLPYMHDSPTIMDIRADISDLVARDLANTGKKVYAPISSWHRIATRYGMRCDWEFWQDLDEEFIRCSNEIHFITLPGWQDSTGVNAETCLAKALDKKIEYIDPTMYLYQLVEVYENSNELSSGDKALRLKFLEFMIQSVGKRKLSIMGIKKELED